VTYAVLDEIKIILLGWPWRSVCTIVAKWCNIEPKMLLSTNRKLILAFNTWFNARDVLTRPKSVTAQARDMLTHPICIAFLRAKAECFARLCHRLGVCLSVCPSVTLVNCIKTVQARITKSSLWAAPRSLVYRDKILCHCVQGFPSSEGVEEVYPSKKTSFCRYWLK